MDRKVVLDEVVMFDGWGLLERWSIDSSEGVKMMGLEKRMINENDSCW